MAPICRVPTSGALTSRKLCYRALTSGVPDLRGTALQGADFGGATLQEAILQGPNFLLNFNRVQRANFLRATLQEAMLQDPNLQLDKLRHADSRRANLRAARLGGPFWGANLGGVNFQGANLQEATFLLANLEGADLEGANLRGADLRAVFGLTAAQLQAAQIDVHTQLSGALQSLPPAGAAVPPSGSPELTE